MRVLYDYQIFSRQDFGGISKCFCELIANMPADIKTSIATKRSNNIHLRHSGLVDGLQAARMTVEAFSREFPLRGYYKIYELLNALGIMHGDDIYDRRLSVRQLKAQQFDVFHPTFFSPYFLKYIGRKPWVITIHDMMPELFPEHFGKNDQQIQFKSQHLGEASTIIAVSESTKRDIVRLLGVPEDKIAVVYHGCPNVERINEKPLVTQPYFLYVGMRHVYKNFKQTAIDFAEFAPRHPEARLVCTGLPFTDEEKRLFSELKILSSTIYYPASDQQLKNLYANAVGFIFPSLYEGFGMPTLEAFAYGCPVLLNDIPVFHEVAADAALFFHSEGGSSNLPALLEKVYGMSKEQRSQIINKGFARLAAFSWKKSAAKLAGIYRQVAGKTNVNVTVKKLKD